MSVREWMVYTDDFRALKSTFYYTHITRISRHLIFFYTRLQLYVCFPSRIAFIFLPTMLLRASFHLSIQISRTTNALLYSIMLLCVIVCAAAQLSPCKQYAVPENKGFRRFKFFTIPTSHVHIKTR